MKEKIVLVNGYLVRQLLDTDFAIMHRHGSGLVTPYDQKPYIPSGQRWVDYRHASEIRHLLQIEKKFAGLEGPYYSRQRDALVQKLQTNRYRITEFMRKTEVHKNFQLIYIDGSLVRQFLDPEFVQGGHDLVYDYIPINQIWVDSLMDSRDHPHIILHETIERELMSQGKSYDIAHDYAVASEKESRRKAGGSYPGDSDRPNYRRHQLLKLLTIY